MTTPLDRPAIQPRTAPRPGLSTALAVLVLLAIGWATARPGFAAPPDRRAIESVIRVAPQEKGGPDEATSFRWGSGLDRLAQGLAKALGEPAAFAALKERMAASPLPENTVRVLDLFDVEVRGQRERFGALLARAAETTEAELLAELAAMPAPITLFFPREEDRRAVLEHGSGRGRVELQVTWDVFWSPQQKLRTLLAYDRHGNRTSYSVDAPPSGPVLVVSTENAQAPEAPRPEVEASAAVEAAEAEVEAAQHCIPYLMLVGLYLIDDHEGWPRGKPEIDLFLADWNPTMPGNVLVIRPTTPYIFSGRNVADARGVSRYLPDVNDKGRWYTFNPVALFSYDQFIGSGLYLVEDDDAAGVLKVTGSYSIGFTCTVFPGCTGTQCGGCQPTGSGFVDLARAVFGAGDDRFAVPFRSVGGAPLGAVLEADMRDWRLRLQVLCG